MVEAVPFQEGVRRIQALERYSLHKSEYEEQLNTALAEYVGTSGPPPEDEAGDPGRTPVPQAPIATSGIPPILVFFVLVLLAGVCFLFALVAGVSAFFTTPDPNNPLSPNRLGGFLTGLLCMGTSIGQFGAAFAVYRMYLRRKHG
jgi:hypothetical protein